MDEKDRHVAVPIEELVLSNVVQAEALVRLLIRKRLVTREEFLDEVRAVQREMPLGGKS